MRVSKKLLVPLLLLLGLQSAFAQNKVVTGKVHDAEDQPVAGVVVLIEGTSKGSMTMEDGSFSIETPAKGDTVLEFSCLGYETKTLTVLAAQSNVAVTLDEDITLLNETVVVGYGVQKKVNLTGSVSVVEEKDLENRITQNISTMLQGLTPGLNITTTSGNPGESADINIRGTTSINGGSPLILIDGAIGSIDSVNPSDVESISVIKDASAAAVYGARAAFGVILVNTKQGSAEEGKAKVHFSGRWGWQSPTSSTDYETTGFWSVYTVNKFWEANRGTGIKYINYTDADMMQLLARVNDKKENPERPWVVTDYRNGRNQWVYYGNYDWWHTLYQDTRPEQQYDLTISGGNNGVKYYVSGGYQHQAGMLRWINDSYTKYNMRTKLDIKLGKWGEFSTNTSFMMSTYDYPGLSTIDNTLAYGARHALACFPMQNPDGSWLYQTPYIDYAVANGRHISVLAGKHRNRTRTFDFYTNERLTINIFPTLKFVGEFSFRQYQTRDTHRYNSYEYRQYPDAEMEYYTTGAGLNELRETCNTQQYYTANAYLSYDETYGGGHHLSATGGVNYEKRYLKNFRAYGDNIISDELDDLALVGTNDAGEVVTTVSGSQSDYVLLGYFARINYDYKGRYLVEVSGRYDGSSRFAKGNRWGFFPSASIGYRISEEPFFEPARKVVDNLKIRGSFGSLGNQNVSSYYTYLRLISTSNLDYSFGEGSSLAKTANIDAPVAGDLTWELVQQYDVGVDVAFLRNRLTLTADVYQRNTIGMLTDGIDLPAVYGASSPDMNAADLKTQGYEVALNWRDHFMLGGRLFEYSVGGMVSDYKCIVTKFANDNKLLTSTYYNGMRMGEIWGFKLDGFIQTQEELDAYVNNIDSSYITYTNGIQIGDVRYKDLNGDGVIGIGKNTVDDPGDQVVLGNSLPSLQYSFNASVKYMGFDIYVMFQGTGNHYWYPAGQSMNFWGPYGYPYCTYLQKDFLSRCWSEENRDAYFPRPMSYATTSGSLRRTNDRYLQNLRYLRLKNITVGYTVPAKVSRKIRIDNIRVYFTGENLTYWSPFKKTCKYMDPEGAFNKDSTTDNTEMDNSFYPWSKTYMFGVDITF